MLSLSPYTFNTSSSYSFLTMKTNPKSDVMPPPPYLCATYHWEPSGLLAKRQAHLPPSHRLKDKCLLLLEAPLPTRSLLEPSVIMQTRCSDTGTCATLILAPRPLLAPSHRASLQPSSEPLGCQGQALHPRVSSESFSFSLVPDPLFTSSMLSASSRFQCYQQANDFHIPFFIPNLCLELHTRYIRYESTKSFEGYTLRADSRAPTISF